MRILVAEDDPVSRRVLEASLAKWGYEVIACSDGLEAWQALQCLGTPEMLILDWMMPGMEGIEICRRVRETTNSKPVYIILLTARERREDVVAGLQAGADDYITKPFDIGELHARLQVGARVIELQGALSDRVTELEDALSHVKQLQGLLPICCYCKKIRNDKNYWQQVEGYISEHSEAEFSHGICPDCYERCVLPELQRLDDQGRSDK